MRAVQQDDYASALLLLKSGADPHKYQPDGLKKVIHFVLHARRNLPLRDKSRESELIALTELLEANGESVAAAQAEREGWLKAYENAVSPSQHAAVTKRLISERKRRGG